MGTFLVRKAAKTDDSTSYLSVTYIYKDLYMHRYAFIHPPLCASSCS